MNNCVSRLLKKAAVRSEFFICCCLMLAVSVPSSVVADDETTVDGLLSLSLEELLNYPVSAPTKADTRMSDVPGSVSVITYDQIRNSAATTIPELLRLIPGVHVRWNPMVQSIEIRSFGSNPFTSRVLLLIDGIPYNSWNKGGFPQHPGFDFFNLENVKHLEVIRGPGSALYGENALNGVINIVTLSGDEYRQTRLTVTAGARDTRSAGISHGGTVGEDASLFVSARAEKTQLPTGLWEGKDTTGEDFFLKAKYRNWQLSYYRRQDDFEGFQQLVVPPDFGYNSVDNIEQKVNIAAISYQHQAADNSWSFKANASYANRDGSHCGSCHAAPQDAVFEQSIDHGYQQFLNAQLGVHQFKHHDLLVGVEARKISSGDSFDQVPSVHDAHEVNSYNKGAVFIQDRMSFMADRLQVVAGLRYDAKTSPSLFNAEWFPRLALVYKVFDKLTLRAGWSVAARYPSFTELYQNIQFFAATSPSGELAFPATDFQPNPDLHLEMVESLEFGLEYQHSDTWQAKLDVFSNLIEDPIVLSYGQHVGFENHPNDARIKGAELEIRAQPSVNLSTFMNWSYQDNKQSGDGLDSNGLPIEFSYAPRHKFNWGLTYHISDNFKSTLELSWRDRSMAPMFWSQLAFATDQPHVLDDYMYLNLRMRYRLPFEFGSNKKPITLSFYGKNLSNEKQAESLTGVDGRAPGREFFLGIDYEWSH